MSTHDYNLANASGAAFRSDLNDALAAIVTQNSGTSWSTTFAHQVVVDTSNGVRKRRNAANGGWIDVETIDETFVLSRSSNTMLDRSDRGKTIIATSTFTQTFDAAATLADDWWCKFRNDGTGVITLDPNSTEQIDGATTLNLYPGESCIIECSGSAFKTVGLRGISMKAGSFTRDMTAASGSAAVTGVGFKPRAVIFLAGDPSSAADNASVGIDDGASPGSLANLNSISAGKWFVPASSIYLFQGASTSQVGSISSMDDDGFTVSWTKTGSPTGTMTIRYLAIR